MGGYGISDGGQSAPFGRVWAKSLADEIAGRLHEAILSGLLRPGEKIVEAALSRQMDVSRAPIREAIRMLVERGLLVQVPRRGVFVREYGLQEIKDINELRLAIETGALSRALTGGYLLQLDDLEQAVQVHNAAGGKNVSLVDKELAIHRTIVQLYPNEQFLRAFDGAANELRLAMAGVRAQQLSEAELCEGYAPLLRAIRTRDCPKAVALLGESVGAFLTHLVLGGPLTKPSEPATGRDRIAG